MSLPERHLDAVYTPGSIDEDAPKVPISRVLGAMILPLFFITAFVLAYVSALHAPVPHDLGLRIAGPDTVTSRVATAIEHRSSSAFDITRTTDTAAARQAVADRHAVGAILIGEGSRPAVTTVIASGGGALAAQTVRSVGAEVAQELGGTATVRDVAPLAPEDSSGSGLFFMIVLCTVGAYLSMTVVAQALPNASRRAKAGIAVVVSVLTPVVAFAAMSFSVGAFGAGFGPVVAMLGVAMLYTLVVAFLALLFTDLIGQASIFAIVLFCLAGNFPSAGGSVPESMLPPFWQAVHAIWYGSGALETFRSLIYFDGAGFGWPFVRLMIWLVAVGIALLAVGVAKGRKEHGATTSDDARADMTTTNAQTAAAPALVGM